MQDGAIKNQLLKHPISLSYIIQLAVIKISTIFTEYNWWSNVKKSFDGSDVIFITLVKRLHKNGSSQQGDATRDANMTNDTTIETRRLYTQENC